MMSPFSPAEDYRGWSAKGLPAGGEGRLTRIVERNRTVDFGLRLPTVTQFSVVLQDDPKSYVFDLVHPVPRLNYQRQHPSSIIEELPRDAIDETKNELVQMPSPTKTHA